MAASLPGGALSASLPLVIMVITGSPDVQYAWTSRSGEQSTLVSQLSMRRKGTSRGVRLTGLQTPERPIRLDLTM